MKNSILLTGIKPTGDAHIGNYLGSIKEALKLSKLFGESYFFIADAHALTGKKSSWNKEEFTKNIYEIAACWLSCGLDPDLSYFYRQSKIPEIFEINWYLSCLCPKGLMNRSHAYKSFLENNKETDTLLGLYSYPVLMSADILTFNADTVPTGEDQLQHLEIARDLAQKFNKQFKKEVFTLPKAHISDQTKLVPGIDGRKMSKSYDNTIPLFCSEKKLKKLIMKIKTDSTPPNEPKKTEDSFIFELYTHFATKEKIEELKKAYDTGISWGEAKELLFTQINEELKDKREKYEHWINNLDKIEEILSQGEQKARKKAQQTLFTVKKAIGV